jgi:hypothetical protein
MAPPVQERRKSAIPSEERAGEDEFEGRSERVEPEEKRKKNERVVAMERGQSTGASAHPRLIHSLDKLPN